MSNDFENSLDGVVDWIENKFSGEENKPQCSERKVEQKRMEIPVPDIRAVTKGMRLTDGEKLQQAVDCMRQLLITARYQISQLEEKNRKLERRLESDCVVRCPACCFAHKTKSNRFFPSYIKAIQSTCTLELTFKTKEDLLSFMVASQLDADQNGVPVLTPAVKPAPKGLGEAGSQLTNLLLEKEKENAKVKIAIRKKDDAPPAQPPTDFSSLSDSSIQEHPSNKSIRKLEHITNRPRTGEKIGDTGKEVNNTWRDCTRTSEYRSTEKTGRRAAEERRRNSRERERNPPRSVGPPPRITKNMPKGTPFSFNSHMISSRDDMAAIESRDSVRPRQASSENNTTDALAHRRGGDIRSEEAGRLRTASRETTKRRCSPVRERSKRRRTPEKEYRRDERRRRKESDWDRKHDDRRPDRGEDSRYRREEQRRDSNSKRTSPKEIASNPSQDTQREMIEPEAPFKCSRSHRSQEGRSAEGNLLGTSKASTSTISPDMGKMPDDQLSEGELIDDELEEVDSDGGNNAVANVEILKEPSDDKSTEEDSIEEDDMNWFGEVVSDDNDVLGENYESASDDDLA